MGGYEYARISIFIRYCLNFINDKSLWTFSRRLRMPSVVGALIAGIVLGPAVLNIVEPSKLIESLSEIGVIVLMFAAGLETSITDLKRLD